VEGCDRYERMRATLDSLDSKSRRNTGSNCEVLESTTMRRPKWSRSFSNLSPSPRISGVTTSIYREDVYVEEL
jgi:hypothetical protein